MMLPAPPKQTLPILWVALCLAMAGCPSSRTPDEPVEPAPDNSPVVPLEALRAMGYVEHATEPADPDKVGVTLHDEARAYPGYSFFHGTLLRIDGEDVHAWPDVDVATILDDGSVLLIRDSTSLEKWTWDGQLLWKRERFVHHDICVCADGTILVPSKEVRPYMGRSVEFDLILRLDADGQELARWSTFDALETLKATHARMALDKPAEGATPSAPEPAVKSAFGGDYDYYHLNAVQELPANPLGATDPRFRAGNWLISLNAAQRIYILDRDSHAIVWHWGEGQLLGQHTPRMLDTGNILLFDNGQAPHRRYSRVLEIDPSSGAIVWQYTGDPVESLFSEHMGSAQRLPNGNTLIASSDQGRVFEVNPDGETVWEWYQGLDDQGRRKIVYRMFRYPAKLIESHLEP